MRIFGITGLITLCVLTIVYSQQSNTPAKGAAKRVGSSGIVNPYAQKGAGQAIAQRKACDAIYRNQIAAKTGDLRKKVAELKITERNIVKKKNQNNANVRKVHESNKQMNDRYRLAFADTSANRAQHIKDVQNERYAAMKKMRAEEARINNDPELVKIRQSISALHKQINDSIAVVVKDDQKCFDCYITTR